MKDLLHKAKNVLDSIDTRVLPPGLAVTVEKLKKEIGDAVAEPRVQQAPKKVAKKTAKKKVTKKAKKKK